MNQQQYFLIKLAEEATEIAQIALKTAQFGPEEKYPGQPFTNYERIHQELNDLNAIVEILNASCNFDYTVSPQEILAKQMKVDKYMKYSIDLGLVHNDFN